MPKGFETESKMARTLFLTWALPGLLILGGPLSVAGQSVPSPYRFFENRQEAGVFGGYKNLGTGKFGYGPKPGLMVGGRYGIHLGGAFALDGVVAFNPTTRDVVDPTREEGTRVVGEADANLLSIDARLRFSLTGDRTWNGLNPFLFMGGGMVWDLAGESATDALVLPDDQFKFGTKFLALFGGGVRWIVSRNLLVRADLSINMNQLSTPPGYLDPDRELGAIGEKEWVSGPTISLAAAWHF